MAAVTIKVRGLDQVQQQLGRVQALPREALPQVLTEAGAILLNRVRTRFLQETDPNGQKWPQSQAAKDRAADPTSGGGTLFDTGRLFRSITLKKGSSNGRFARGLSRVIFTDTPYAAAHQFGRGQKQRIFLGFSDGDILVLEKLVQARITGALRG